MIKRISLTLFHKKNGLHRYKYLVRQGQIYLVKKHSYFIRKFFETDVTQNRFLIDNIFVMFGGLVFLVRFLWVPTVFLLLPTCSFMQELCKKNEKKLVRSCNFTLCYWYIYSFIEQIIVWQLHVYIDYIFHIELEIQNTKDTARSAYTWSQA